MEPSVERSQPKEVSRQGAKTQRKGWTEQEGTRIFTDATDLHGLIFLPTIFLSEMTNQTRPSAKGGQEDDRNIEGRKIMSKEVCTEFFASWRLCVSPASVAIGPRWAVRGGTSVPIRATNGQNLRTMRKFWKHSSFLVAARTNQPRWVPSVADNHVMTTHPWPSLTESEP
jgi:hypothetical protein